MKTCSKCHVPKDPSEFGLGKTYSDGLKCWCRECCRKQARVFARTPEQQQKRKQWADDHKERLRQQAKYRWKTRKHIYEPARQRWALEHKEEMLALSRERRVQFRSFIDFLKTGKPCADCGGLFAPYIMEYDHVRGEKRFAIGRMTNHRQSRVLEEIDKCDLVCCNCHRVRTQYRKGASTLTKVQLFRAKLDALKGKPCTDCGKTFPSVAMDFDHVWGVKEIGIAQMWCWGWDKVEKELSKCELVCANCHRERSVHQVDSLRRVA